MGKLIDHDLESLSVSEAQNVIRGAVEPIEDSELVSLRTALDRILSEDVVSPINVPEHDSCAMDGYALSGASLKAVTPTDLRIAGVAYAGHPYPGVVGSDECVVIMTGAVIPKGCNTVVPKELVKATDTCVTIPPNTVLPGANCRLKGEGLRYGQTAIQKGTILRPAALGLLASLGVAEVSVRKRLLVAYFSTGDELCSLGEKLESGCVYDSNRYTLHGMLTRLGCEVIDYGIVPDDPVALEATLRACSEIADVVITSGGVSVGAADYFRHITERLGHVNFWKIGMRPGKPLAFGLIESNNHPAIFFGLPGNPVAAMISFYFFVREALLKAMGAQSTPVPMMRVHASTPIRKCTGRTEFQRGMVLTDECGRQSVSVYAEQGSAILRSMTEANCIVVLEQDRGDVMVGEDVDVILFEGLI